MENQQACFAGGNSPPLPKTPVIPSGVFLILSFRIGQELHKNGKKSGKKGIRLELYRQLQEGATLKIQ